MTAPVLVDARGMLCPLPVLRLRKILQGLPPGGRARLLASDPMAVVDVPHFCAGAGHVMVTTCDLGDGQHEFVVERGPDGSQDDPNAPETE
ncbi:sulfurtransferase TusA family protein [Paracoccus seriniphilus]|uniref:sulfurtransferase TusA family protein n=1 Tax=Paracoccus seriniphilus TaxID=184748 RepID=UPI003561DC7C